jgi:tRNA A37 threonylcarbamoyladenosine modification protein TsaB
LLAIANGQPVSTPDANLAELARGAGLTVAAAQPITAHQIAKVGWAKLRAGQTVSPDQLEANYIRRTDAEIFAKPIASS